MKKTTVIIVAICYLSAVALISFFGINTNVLDANIPVTQVLCINESDNSSIVEDMGDYTRIKVKFTTPGDMATATGTMVQLEWRVLPDDASNKDIIFVYSDNDNVHFVTDGDGDELGLVLFYGTEVLDVKIQATDGTKIYANVRIIVY